MVDLFLVLPALGLAVGAVPVEQDGERDDEERVRHGDRRHDREHDVVPVAQRKKELWNILLPDLLMSHCSSLLKVSITIQGFSLL